MADGGQIAARALYYAALLLTAGLPIYFLTAGRSLVFTLRLRAVAALLALLGAAASVWLALASVAAMASMDLFALDRELVSAVLAATPLGLALNIRLASLLLIIIVLFAVPVRLQLPLAALLGGVALASSAITGHSGATEGALGTLHRIADVAHLLAAATWMAALAMLLANLFGRAKADTLTRLLAGFAKSGTIVVLMLLVTGLINTFAIVGWPISGSALTSAWSTVLAAKLGLFAVMLCLAALNRWRFTPALERDGGSGAISLLRISLMVEAAAGATIVLLVAILGLLDPSS